MAKDKVKNGKSKASSGTLKVKVKGPAPQVMKLLGKGK